MVLSRTGGRFPSWDRNWSRTRKHPARLMSQKRIAPSKPPLIRIHSLEVDHSKDMIPSETIDEDKHKNTTRMAYHHYTSRKELTMMTGQRVSKGSGSNITQTDLNICTSGSDEHMRCCNWRHCGTVHFSGHLKIHDYLGKENHVRMTREHWNQHLNGAKH